jgi:branched-chain amino acid transport system ATP-binding protein
LILELQNVLKSFGALRVTDNVTFAVPEGEVLGVIGPNGAGKSTLFNLIAGTIRPEAGAIRFADRDVTGESPMVRCLHGIGRTFQIPQPFEQLTVFENLLVAGAFGSRRREGEVADRCAEILVETRLLGRANQLAGKLGLLQRKRLELARALATDPRLLLLDEIAGGLTEAECQSLVETIRGVRHRGVSIIWIEHVLHALNAVVDRLLVLNFGKVIGLGKPAEIMTSRDVREIYVGIEV